MINNSVIGEKIEKDDQIFGMLHAGFIFIPKVKITEQGILIVRGDKYIPWSRIKKIIRRDEGIWRFTRMPMGTIIYLDNGESLWINSRVLRKMDPLTPKSRLWMVHKTLDYEYILNEIKKHTKLDILSSGERIKKVSILIRLILLGILSIFIILVILSLLT